MNKLEILQKKLKELGKVAIAYSGGADSHFLLAVAARCLPKDCVLPIFCSGVMISGEEIREAKERMGKFGGPFCILHADVLQIPAFAQNEPQRCYYCKKYLMGRIREKAAEMGFQWVLDGKNSDDGAVYRPGARAADELGILSPLFACGFTKQEIRECSKRLGLETWDKPANACLATRFPYGTHLTEEILLRAENAEKVLHEARILGGRVRVHGDIARIEIANQYFSAVLGNEELIGKIKEQGFAFVTLDLEGFRSGSFDGNVSGKSVPERKEWKLPKKGQSEKGLGAHDCDTAVEENAKGDQGVTEPAVYGDEIREEVTVLETNLDDCTGEWMGHVMELLLEAGARDVFYLPVFMKKNRPGYKMTVLCDEEKAAALERVIFRETTTIGIRRRKESRTVLPRTKKTRNTKYGILEVKEVPGGRAYPEYESAKKLAREKGVGLPDIYRSVEE